MVRSAAPQAATARTPLGLPSTLDYPVQPSKVQAPPLRDDTLARDRLLDWLSVKVHSRAILLVAEAGYGKTTLLADFSRRTRVRVLWYRLDRGDRDWVGFIAHLVAAVRVHLPAFGPSTAALLRETATSSPSIETVLNTFLRELGGLPNEPTALVFDDVHLVDDSADVRQILRELLARGPERMSLVFASRREPPIRLARLRALGEVAELDTDDLRFDAAETERLFRDTYEMPLEASVIAELSRRTEGWAASLQLVRAAIHDRNPAQVRSFISSLSGAEGHLYEYLAEEVIGDLPDDLQQFLMRTSLLDTVDLTLGPVAAGVSEEQARTLIESAQMHGLFGKAGRDRHLARGHPLVRQFLRARLLRSIGRPGVLEIHRRIARAAEPLDWKVSAQHFAASGLDEDARRVISGAIDSILASGAYAAAQELAETLGESFLAGPTGLILQSRLYQQRGAILEALELAERALVADPKSSPALLNLSSARAVAGDVSGAIEVARRLATGDHREFASLGHVVAASLAASLDGRFDVAEQAIAGLEVALEGRAASHYLGVARLNHSLIQLAKGDFESAAESASTAIGHLGMSSAGIELISAEVAHASAVAFMGDINGARAEIAAALDRAPAGQDFELAADIAEVEALVGESSRAWPLIAGVAERIKTSTDLGEQVLFARSLLSMRDGDLDHARADLEHLQHGIARPAVAFEAKRLLAEALFETLAGRSTAPVSAQRGMRWASAQGATFWAAFGELLSVLADRRRDPSDALVRASVEMPAVISSLAEIVIERLPEMHAPAQVVASEEVVRRPWRWRPPLRRALEHASDGEIARLAELLERIGEAEDIGRLRQASKRANTAIAAKLGLSLARRLAERVFVEDLGRVQILIGTRLVEGGEVRRKVLALLTFLLSRPKFSSTRDEVLDNLWPDNDPTAALNSLNQTVYFLRRVFEPQFREEVSPGYLGQDGETIWLDPELIDCRSRRCARIIQAMPSVPTADGSVELAREYRGRFALDFSYEEWSVAYRDTLHASYLRVVEHAVRLDLDNGHFGRGTFIAERAAEVDPDSEEIQAALVRLYRHSGAHAAAAEQYGHYARTLRELGIDPPLFADV